MVPPLAGFARGAKGLALLACRRGLPTAGGRRGCAGSAAARLRRVDDAGLEKLVERGEPVLLHCGTPWASQRSAAVAGRLAEWAQHGSGVECVSADLNSIPVAAEQRAFSSLPVVLLFRGGKVEKRADGADVAALESILSLAGKFSNVASAEQPAVEENCSAEDALTVAEELFRAGRAPAVVQPFFLHALEADPAFGFRARLGLLRCAMKESSAPSNPEPAVTALKMLHQHHREDMMHAGDRGDAQGVVQFVADAELRVDAWRAEAEGDEKEVLEKFAKGEFQEAVDAALLWYQSAALEDMQGLVTAYASPARRIPDSQLHSLHPESVYNDDQLACNVDEAPGPAAPRAMLRRLFAALGPKHEATLRGRADLELLIDRKPHVQFHTRKVHLRRGGPPARGRGTGKRSGFSKKYWVTWGPGTLYPNTKKMGTPHCDAGD